MRDALFAEFYSIFIHEGIQFVVGLIMFVAGLSFIGGFIYHRDKKRQLTKKDTQTNSSMGGKVMKTAKFGGSSLADGEQFKKVAKIIQADSERKFIIVSAPGKRYDNDYKLTDLLIRFAKAYIEKDKYKSYFITIMDRFQKITEALGLSDDIIEEIE